MKINSKQKFLRAQARRKSLPSALLKMAKDNNKKKRMKDDLEKSLVRQKEIERFHGMGELTAPAVDVVEMQSQE